MQLLTPTDSNPVIVYVGGSKLTGLQSTSSCWHPAPETFSYTGQVSIWWGETTELGSMDPFMKLVLLKVYLIMFKSKLLAEIM